MWRTSLKLVSIITTTFGVCTIYIGRVIGCRMNAGMPIGQQLACWPKTGLPESTSSLRLRTCSRAQGCRIGLLRSATGWVGCRPVTRNSSLVTCGRVGSCSTGPGPLAGGIHAREYANQLVLAVGAKLGGDALWAIAEWLPAK